MELYLYSPCMPSFYKQGWRYLFTRSLYGICFVSLSVSQQTVHKTFKKEDILTNQISGVSVKIMMMHDGIACRNSIAILEKMSLVATEQMHKKTKEISR